MFFGVFGTTPKGQYRKHNQKFSNAHPVWIVIELLVNYLVTVILAKQRLSCGISCSSSFYRALLI
ncbi:MAG: hypothetical protein ACJAU2_000293 [Maribacter sp.]